MKSPFPIKRTSSYFPKVNRRRFLQSSTFPIFLMAFPGKSIGFSAANVTELEQPLEKPLFETRGIVLSVSDLSTLDWPRRAHAAGLTTIGTHVTPGQVSEFIQSEAGQQFQKDCKRLGIQIEHELHAMGDLLPRELFDRDPSMFRMNEDGERIPDYNCCAHSKNAIEIICQNAVKYSKLLLSSTGRYFYWIDDGRPMCKCKKCREYSDSDQALLLENAILAALRREVNEHAALAHLAYANTLKPPSLIKPSEGIFLEFAPIRRSWQEPIRNRSAEGRGMTHGENLDYLDANLEIFPKETAQVLEYWIDVSLFSGWKRPAVQLPWRPDVFLADIDTYARRGIRHITSFGVYIDSDYVKKYGDPHFIDEYGKGLLTYRLEESVVE